MQEDAIREGPAVDSSQALAKAAVFCTTFLPYSQTFVWDELRSHRRYEVEVFAWRRANVEMFPAAVHVARPWYPLTRRDGDFDRRLRHGAFGLIHAHFGWAGALACGFAARHRLPLVVSFHGLDVALLAGRGRGPLRVWPYTFRADQMLAGMTLGLCASAELLELLVARGVARQRLREHRLGVDLERFRPERRDPQGLRIAMVGRLVEKKGFADGLRAFALLPRHCPQATLDIAGSGPLESSLRRLASKLGVEQRVRFLGSVSHPEIAALLARADVLLAPSRIARDGDRDSGLLSAKEAGACGCVTVATRHGGLPDIVDDGVTGFLVDEGDIDGIARWLTELAVAPIRRSAMGAAARDKMTREYGLDSSVARLERFYDEAVVRHRQEQRGS